MKKSPHRLGLGTLTLHLEEGQNPYHANVAPIYHSSVFNFPDVATGQRIFTGEQEGYIYTRLRNPNHDQLAKKYAALEALDLLRSQPSTDLDQIAAGMIFSSGMAAVTSTLLALAQAGDTIIVQQALYGNTYTFISEIAAKLGIQAAWVGDLSPQGWQAAFEAHPEAVLAFAETPSNPTLRVVDLVALAEITHHYGAWLVVDNTFATPYCQRPLTLGADVVVHSTTKFLSGHGVVTGGAVISRHLDFIRETMQETLKAFGGVASPFDSWLANLGLKTFELRMQRHCENAAQIARYLEAHPQVGRVYYPGLQSDPDHATARKQMEYYGAMLSFELKGGFKAGEELMDSLQVISLAASLGNVDSLIVHPASMTHYIMQPEDRLKAGVTDGLVRLSVGIENLEDLLEDLEQALRQT